MEALNGNTDCLFTRLLLGAYNVTHLKLLNDVWHIANAS